MDQVKLLIIDDQADDEKAKLTAWSGRVDFRVRYPWDVSENDLIFANVVVVDYRLDQIWEARDALEQIALKPRNGLALASVLRSQERIMDGGPTAFLLRSAHLLDLSPEFPPESRLHVIAHQNNLEWVLSKNGDVNEQMNQIICLAKAVDALPDNWPHVDAAGMKELLRGWLNVPANERWSDLAWQDIEECHPPLHELSTSKQGLRLIRWMLHRILPYPCFLMTINRLAVRLKVTEESLKAAVEDGLAECFAAGAYMGALNQFDRRARWWGRGIESILWDLTDGQSFNVSRTLEVLNSICGQKLVPLVMSQPILCLDKEYQFRGQPCELLEAVQVQPDDWPAYAEQAWASIADVHADERLRAIVVSSDRERILEEEA